MPSKQSVKSGKNPNGLAAAIARAKLTDPDLGPTKLARLTKENKQSIDRYIKGERKLPRLVAEKLAPHVQATVAELLLVDYGAPDIQEVPLISWVSAGRLATQEGIRNIDVEEKIAVTDLPRGNWLALRVRGDSMDRIAPDGSIVFVNRADNEPKEDKFYVFAIGETGEATFKRFRGGKTIRLQPYSTNADHETMTAPEDLRVIGRVRRIVTDLR